MYDRGMRQRVLLLSAIVVTLASAAVAAARPSAGGLRIAAASSLGTVLERIAPGANVALGGSDELALQIRAGAPVDLFASASPVYTQALFREGLVERPVAFAANRLVVVVPARNPGRIDRVSDLARPGVKVVLASPSVPAGGYARTALHRLGLERRVLANVVSNEPDAKSVLGKVAFGVADAGIVYATDARAAGARVRAIAIPARAQPAIRYEIAIVRGTGRRQEAQALIGRLRSARGAAVLRGAGFLPLPGGGP